MRWQVGLAAMVVAGIVACVESERVGTSTSGDGSEAAALADGRDPCSDSRAIRVAEGLRFERGRGGPDVATRHLSLPFDGSYCVVVRNGEQAPPRGRRVSAAEVALDEHQLFGPRAFNQHVDELRASLALGEGNHTLTVRMRAAPGSFIEISVLGFPRPGLPFEVVAAAPRRTFVAGEGELGTLEFQLLDVAGTPLPATPVVVRVAVQPVESRGVFLVDPIGRHVVQVPPDVGPDERGDDELGLRLVTDGEGRATFQVQALELTGYVLVVGIPGFPWLPDWAMYVETVPSSGAWVDLSPSLTDSPEPRFWANMMLDERRGRMLLFGGRGPGGPGPGGAWADLWALPTPYDLTPPTGWTPVASPTTPPPEAGTAAVYVPGRDTVILFTAAGPPSPTELAVWEFRFDAPDGLSGSWSRLSPTIGADNELPEPLQAHRYGQAVYDPVRRRVILFGGWVEPRDVPPYFGWTRDVIFLDLSTGWEGVLAGRLAPVPVAPRSHFGALFDPLRDRMVIYGGGNPADGTLTDVWQLAFGAEPYGTWSVMAQSPDPVHGLPPQRENFTFAVDKFRERAIIFGGLLTGEPWTGARPATDQVWEMRLSGEAGVQWYRLFPVAAGPGTPAARDAHSGAGAFTWETGRMVVFGGIAADDTILDETWQIQWRYDPVGRILFAQCSPGVVFTDGSDRTRCEFQWDERLGIRTATLTLPGGAFVADHAGPAVPLFDDASHGDLAAGDGIWTRDDISYVGTALPTLLPQQITFRVVGTGTLGSYETATSVGIVGREVVTVVPDATDPDVFRSPYALFLVDRAREFLADYRSRSPDAMVMTPAYKAYSKATNYLDPDRFELACVAFARHIWYASATRSGVMASLGTYVRTPALNIGRPPDYDASNPACCGLSSAGSCPRCRNLLGLCKLNHPGPLVHEIGHTWSTAFGSGGYTPPPPYLSSDSHWRAGTGSFGGVAGNPTTDIASVMSARQNVFLPVSDLPCRFTYAGAPTFDEYDLHLMGLLPAAELPEVALMHDPVPPADLGSGTPGECSRLERLPAATYVALAGGERIPATGPSSFDFSLVVISPDPFTDAEYVYFDRWSRWLESAEAGAFLDATGGRATISSRL